MLRFIDRSILNRVIIVKMPIATNKIFFYASLVSTIVYTCELFYLTLHRTTTLPHCIIISLLKCVASCIICLISLQSIYHKREDKFNEKMKKYDDPTLSQESSENKHR